MDTPMFSLCNCLKNQPVEGLPDANDEPLTSTDEGAIPDSSRGGMLPAGVPATLLVPSDAEPEARMSKNHRAAEDRSGGRCQIKQTRIVLLIWTTLIVMIGILPLDNFVGHSHWEYIKWIPNAQDLQSPKYLLDIFTDIIGNTALFFPFGYLLSRLLSNRTRSVQLIFPFALAGALSVSIEYYQIYCHNRFPGIIDVICNVSGSLIGVRFARFRNAFWD